MSFNAIATLQARGILGGKKKAVARVADVLLLAAITTGHAFAQVGGGTGTGAAVQGRATSVMSTGQAILFGLGGFVFTAAILYHCYGVGWSGKKWNEVGNACGAAAVGGACVIIVNWLYL